MERTLVIVKPDAFQRNFIGRIINRLEEKGLQLVGLKMVRLDGDMLDSHYAHLVDKPFFTEIKEFMAKTPVIVSCWEGADCVATVRQLCGVTKAREAEPGTIRGDWAMSIQANLVHASDSIESAQEEIARFFNDGEIYSYELVSAGFIYSSRERT